MPLYQEKKPKIKSVSYAKYGYLFSLPFIIIFLIFMLYPTVFTAVIGFTDFENFASIIANKTFRASLVNTIVIWVMNFIPQIGLALLLTAWFTNRSRKIRGQGAFKVLFYLPNIITAATVAILYASIFAYPVGPVNSILQSCQNFFGKLIGLAGPELAATIKPFDFSTSPWAAKIVVAFIQFWQWYGYTTIILISGVLGINPELFEAAEIDGASPRQTFFQITLPCMRTILIFTLITSLIGGLNMFDIPKLYIWNGGPANATMTTSVFIYAQAFSGSYLYNKAAAASMIMFVIIAILSGFTFFLMRDRSELKAKRAMKRMEKLSKGAEA